MLLFKERFKQPILDGTKTVTRRGLKRKFKVGSVHQAYTRPPWCVPAGAPFARLKVLSVTFGKLGDVDEAEARREGFASLDDFYEYLAGKRAGKMTPLELAGLLHTEVQRIEFKVVK